MTFPERLCTGKITPSAKPVVHPTLIIFDYEAGLLQQVAVVVLPDRFIHEVGPAVQRIPQFKLLNRPVIKATFVEIAEAYSLPFIRLEQVVPVVVLGKVHQDVKAVPFTLLFPRLFRSRLFLDLYAVLLGQEPNRLQVAHSLVLHDEGYGITPLSAAEILENALCWNNEE